MLNWGSTGMTVVMRSLLNAIGSGVLSFLTTIQVTDNTQDALIVGAITALGALGIRGGIEGGSDIARDRAGTVLASDPGQNKQTAAIQTAENVAKA